jgi:hypothetical protein
MFDISMSDCKTDWLWMSIGFSGCAEFVFDWMKRGRPVGMGNAGKGSRIPTLESKSIQGWGTPSVWFGQGWATRLIQSELIVYSSSLSSIFTAKPESRTRAEVHPEARMGFVCLVLRVFICGRVLRELSI